MSGPRVRSPRPIARFVVACVAVATGATVVATTSAPTRAEAAAPAPPGAGQGSPQPELTRAPELLRFVPAVVPEPESTRTASVAAVLELRLDDEGAVEDVAVVESSGSPALDAAAVTAARAFEFYPAEIDGAPAAIRIQYRYVFAFAAPKAATGGLEGRVRARGQARPIAGARVTVRGEGLEARTTTTSTSGWFAFERLRPGDVVVRLEGEGLVAVETRETVEGGETIEVRYDVTVATPADEADAEADDLEIVVTAPAIRRQVVATRVTAEEARQVPGTSGDVLRVVESLPGVARASVGSGALVVWGAAPDETRVYVDGVPVPRLYHEGGLRSVVHPDFVETLELIPGAPSASYGRSLGGVVAVKSGTPEQDGLRGSVAADVLDASVALSGPVAEDVVLATALRVSLLDLWAEAALGEDVTEYAPIPRYRDGQVRLSFRPSPRDRVEVVALGSSDRFARGVPNADPALATRDVRALDFGRIFLRWTREDGEGGALTVTPWLGLDDGERESTFGDVATRIGTRTFSSGLRLSYRQKLTAAISVEAGVDAEVSRSAVEQRGSIGLPSREGDVRAFGQPPPDRIAADAWTVTSVGVAPYAELNLELFDRLTVTPGLRLDPYARSISRRLPREGDAPAVGLFAQNFAAEPRLALRLRAFDALTLRAAFAIVHQLPAREDLSASFGTPSLPTSSGLHAVFGADLALLESLALGVTSFVVQSDGLAMRDASTAPLRAEALLPTGAGRNFGVQALLRRSLADGLLGWLAYTWMRSDRRDREGESWRASDYEQSHVLAAVLSYTLPWDIQVGARFRAASGFPRTQVIGAYYDARRDRYEPIFGPRNRDRIPFFTQLDLRASKTLALADTRLEVSLEVLNVTNTRNAEELVYAPDYSRRDRVRGLPILPVLGARWTF